MQAARRELAAGLTEDLRGIDTRIRETRKTPATAVRAAGTSLTGLFGAGPVIAAAVPGDVRHVARFPGRDHFAADDGTAPIEVSCGGRKIWRLDRRGNRRLHHAIHMAAVTQIRHRHSHGRAYFAKKPAEGKTRKEALRCLKRQISDAIYACLQAGAARAATVAAASEPGRATGERLTDRRGRRTPPAPALRVSHSQARNQPTTKATGPAPAPFPAPLPSRAAGRPGQGPGKARPLSGAPQGALDPADCEPIMPRSGKGRAHRPRPPR